jgi:hypothetical protein
LRLYFSPRLFIDALFVGCNPAAMRDLVLQTLDAPFSFSDV